MDGRPGGHQLNLVFERDMRRRGIRHQSPRRAAQSRPSRRREPASIQDQRLGRLGPRLAAATRLDPLADLPAPLLLPPGHRLEGQSHLAHANRTALLAPLAHAVSSSSQSPSNAVDNLTSSGPSITTTTSLPTYNYTSRRSNRSPDAPRPRIPVDLFRVRLPLLAPGLRLMGGGWRRRGGCRTRAYG